MCYQELAKSLKSADSFHKNLSLLFDDMVSLIKERTYDCRDFENLLGPEGYYGIWKADNSGSIRSWIFGINNNIFFTVIVVATEDRLLQGNSNLFRSLCAQLERDPKFPLFLLYGIIDPCDLNRFRTDLNLRRAWITHATLVNQADLLHYPDINVYEFGETITIINEDAGNTWWCGKASFVIRDLMAVTDTDALTRVVDEFFRFVAAQNNNAAQGAAQAQIMGD